MATKKLNDLFEVSYGNKFDLNKMTRLPRAKGGINFVNRSSRNHGVSGTVAKLPNVDPYPAGIITVALGGSKLLSSFVQQGPFYTGQNVAVLTPKQPMTDAQKIFVCLCIRQNRFKYSAFGREANRTIRELRIPEPSDFPAWLKDKDATFEHEAAPLKRAPYSLSTKGWKAFALSELFDIRKGRRLTKAESIPGSTPFIAAIDKNNGIDRYIAQEPDQPANTITVPYNGSVGEAFYQSEPFRASDDINVLCPKFELNPAIALFLTTVIRHEKYRFTYGRKWHKERMEATRIRLPVTKSGTPDWEFMTNYIASLPYSKVLPAEA